MRRLLPAPTSLAILGGVIAISALLVASADSLGGSAAFLTALLCVAGAFVLAHSVEHHRGRGDAHRGELGDHVDVEEQAMLDSIADFGDTVVREVMVPRLDMVTVDARFRAADVIEVMLLNGYSRLPACGDGIDDVVGLVYAKDLMRAERDGMHERPVAEMLRPASFVPETKRLPELLREMQQRQFHMAVVVDEYGGTAGLVTLEDIIEELVGEIVDEYDVEDPMIEPLPGGDALVRARTSVAELNDLLQADLPAGDWDTVGGLLYSRLNHVPVEGETVEVAGWLLTAERVQGRRIGRVRLSRLPVSDAREARGGDLPSDAGVIGGIEALPFGLLIFVVGALLVANAWSVIDAKLAVSAAAREATRHHVEAELVSSADAALAEQEAVDAGLDALIAHGRDPGRADVRLTAVDSPAGDGRLVRCARVTYTATYQVPAVALPWIGGFGNGFHVSARHSELVDPFRDGLPGDASGMLKGPGRRTAERGSVMMLMPACLLIVLLLASIAVDMTIVHLRQRQAFDVAASAANDAVTAAADPVQLRSGVYRVEPAAARRVVERAIAASDLAAHLAAPPRVSVDGNQVAVQLTVRADYLFTAALPGTPESTNVTVTASATVIAP